MQLKLSGLIVAICNITHTSDQLPTILKSCPSDLFACKTKNLSAQFNMFQPEFLQENVVVETLVAPFLHGIRMLASTLTCL